MRASTGLWLTSSHLQTGDLHCTYSGHFEEITGLVLRGQTIVSVSIDATIRQWSLKAEDMSRVIAEKNDKENGWESEGNRYVTNFQDIDSDEETELDQLMAQE